MSDDMSERWSLLDKAGVRDVAQQAAKRIHGRYSQYVELDDLKQEAMIALVTVPSIVALLEEDDVELGLVQHGLEQAITKRIETDVRRRSKQISYNRIEGGDEDELGFGAQYTPLPALSEDYNREMVEMLLPAVWDEGYTYGLPPKDNAPDPDMPRGASNPKTGNNLPAYIADIKTGWDRAPLTRKERRAVLMTYGLGWTQKMVAGHEGISQQAISARLYTAIGKIVARLNGGIWYELGAVEA